MVDEKQYKLLPHYSVRDGSLLFLNGHKLPQALSNTLSSQLIKNTFLTKADISEQDQLTFLRLIQEGVLVGQFEKTQGVSGYDSLFIQPHADDCALSCGGLIAKTYYELKTNIAVSTVFSHCSVIYSPWKDLIKLSQKSYSELRNLEDNIFIGYFDGKLFNLNFHEALLRGIRYPILEKGLFKKDLKLIELIFEQTNRLIHEFHFKNIFLPFGIGWNCDHQILTEVAKRLSKTSTVFLYEDYPYCDECRYTYWARLSEVSSSVSLEPLYYDITNYVDMKTDFINCYKSQFKDWSRRDIKKQVMALSQSVAIEAKEWHQKKAKSKYMERVWRIMA